MDKRKKNARNNQNTFMIELCQKYIYSTGYSTALSYKGLMLVGESQGLDLEEIRLAE